MKANAVVVLLALGIVACGHKKPKEAKDAKSTAAPPAAAENKCEVKGFSYSMPEPGPIKDAKDVAAASSDGGAQ